MSLYNNFFLCQPEYIVTQNLIHLPIEYNPWLRYFRAYKAISEYEQV